MISHPNSSGSESFPLPFPESPSLSGLFGMAPVKPGFYGYDWGNTLLLTTNHRPSLIKVGQLANSQPVNALALDTGGFGPADACALGLVDRNRVETALSEYEKDHSIQTGQLLVPHLLAVKFGWTDETRLGRWSVRVVPGNAERLAGFLKPEAEPKRLRESHLPGFLRRLLLGLRLWLLEALILAIPLFVFGWQSLLLGLAGLLVSALLLGLLWPILPGRAWLKGLVLGLLLSIGLALVLVLVLKVSFLPAFGLLLACLWTGVVFSGARY